MNTSSLSHQIADLLTEGLPPVLNTLCIQRYGAPLSLRRLPTPDPSSSTRFLQLEWGNRPSIDVQIHVHHVGGNMYDVEGSLEEGPTKSFSYCLPDPMPLVGPKAPRVIYKIATFLLNTLERQLGGALLRHELHQKLSPSHERRRSDAARPNRSAA